MHERKGLVSEVVKIKDSQRGGTAKVNRHAEI